MPDPDQLFPTLEWLQDPWHVVTERTGEKFHPPELDYDMHLIAEIEKAIPSGHVWTCECRKGQWRRHMVPHTGVPLAQDQANT